MAQLETPAEAPQLGLHEYLRVVRRRIRLVVLVAMALLSLAALYVTRLPRVYRATASLVIEVNTPPVLGDLQDVAPLGAGQYWSDQEYYQTQYRIIESRFLAERVVARLGLERDLDFLGLRELARDMTEAELQRELAEADPAALVLAGLHVTPVMDSRLVEVSFDDTDPARAAQLANAIAESFIEQNLEQKLDTTRKASSWLRDQLGDLEDKLNQSEVRFRDFKTHASILTDSLEDRQNIVAQNLLRLNTELSSARATRVQLDARYKQLKAAQKASDLESMPEVMDSGLVSTLRERQAQLRNEIADLESRYKDGHPRLLLARDQLRVLDEAVTVEVGRFARALEARYQAAVATEHGLEETITVETKKALALAENETDFSRLKREKETNQRLFDIVVTRLKEADLTGMLRTNNIRMLDAALVPTQPFKPRVKVVFALALAFALAAGIGVGFLAEYSDRTIKSWQDLELALGVPFLGLVPTIRNREASSQQGRDQYVRAHPTSQAAECYRSIRTNLLFMGTDRPMRSLVVTSPGRADGKTSTAVNLAATMAISGARVLVVDADLRLPRVHQVFGVPNDQGLTMLLMGQVTAERACKATDLVGLDILPCGPRPPNPAELLQSERFHVVAKELAERYELIIYDSPPVLAVTDAKILSAVCDGTILVARFGKTVRDAALRAVRELQQVRGRLLGVVVNGVDMGSVDAAYYHSYYRQYYTGEEREQDPAQSRT